jgi:hypothetical protein
MPFGQGRSGGRGRGDKKAGDKEKGQRRTLFRRRKVCKFCADKIDDINYKDVKLLGTVRAGARQDSAAAHLGHLRHASAQAADRDQARASDRADPLRDGLNRVIEQLGNRVIEWVYCQSIANQLPD